MKFLKSHCLLLASALVFSVACSPQLAPEIDVPEIPAGTKDEIRGRLSVAVSGVEFRDVRPSSAIESSEQIGTVTQPGGDTSAEVKQAVADALAKRGISIQPDAGRWLNGEVKRWQTKVTTRASSLIESEAVIYVEVASESGEKLFSGNYYGSRSSQFPVASEVDIKYSLGLAMSQAVDQMVEDADLINALWKQ